MTFSERINQMAVDTFEEIQNIEKEYQRAYEELKKYPKGASSDPEYIRKAARAEADYTAAEAKRRDMSFNGFGRTENTLADLRREYEKETRKKFNADPADIDMAALELLKSGILKPNEYSSMLDKAANNGNVTMARLIAKYAGDAAKEYENKYGASDPRARELRLVARIDVLDPTTAALRVFDTLSDIIKRTVRNPSMIRYWEQLSAGLIDQL